MRYSFCPVCGNKLVYKPVGDEGEIPFCQGCERPWFDSFYTCVLSVVVNENDEVLLIRQSYGDTAKYVGVAGFMKCGESAEDSAVREIKEETGLECCELLNLGSIFYEARDQLMIGFMARVKKSELTLSSEVLSGEWFTADEAIRKVRPGSIIQELIRRAKEKI
ncbi:MAG: NUDIX domain-containing protein [Ruminococcus sp.]|nr:NUDIX domain-containing protein [Ruminococcus sp.]